MSDHYTRVSTGGGVPAADAKILGVLFGEQNGPDVSVYDASEVGYEMTKHGIQLNQASVDKQKDLYSAVYPTYEVLGWYSVGTEPSEVDISVQRQMMRYNESPLFIMLNPTPAAGAKDLPVSVYESEVHMAPAEQQHQQHQQHQQQQQQAGTVFVPLNFRLQTAQAEQISVEHVAQATPTQGTSTIDRHAITMSTSLRTLSARVAVLKRYLTAVRASQVPPDYKLLRQISAIVSELHAMEPGEALHEEFMSEYSDSLILANLAITNKAASVLENVLSRFMVAQGDKQRSGSGMRGL